MQTDPLVLFLRKRDRRAFAALVRATRDPVLRAAHRVLGDRQLAEDVTQEVFVKLLTTRWRPEEVRNGRGLLVTTAVQAARTRLRGEIRRDERERVAADRRAAQPVPLDPDDVQEIRAAVDALPETLRRCVELRYFGGLSLAEVAETASMPLRTVSERLRQARDHLAGRLTAVRYAVVLGFVAGDEETGLADPEPSAELDAGLDRISHEGVAWTAVARGGGALGRWILAGVVALIGAAALTYVVPKYFDGGPADEAADAETAETDMDAAEAGDTARDSADGSDGTRGRRADADAALQEAPPVDDEAPEAAESKRGFRVLVVDASGDVVRKGALHLDLYGWPDQAVLALLKPHEHLRGPHDLAGANPVLIEGLPAAADGVRLEAQAIVPGHCPSEEVRFGLSADMATVRITVVRPRRVAFTVLDRATGEPVEGALLLGLTELDRRDVEAEEAARIGGVATGRTDAEGRCAVDGFGRGLHEVQVTADGYRAAVVKDVDPSTSPTVRLERAAETGTVTAVVLDHHGRPVAGIDVELHLADRDTKETATTDDRGVARFEDVPAGYHRVMLDILTWVEKHRVGKDVDEEADEALLAFFDLEPGTTYEARLGFLQGRGVLTIELADLDGRPAEGVPVSLTGPTDREATSDAHGRVSFERLPDGAYGVDVSEWSASSDVPVGASGPVHVRRVVGEATLRGKAVALDTGKPVAKAMILAIGEETASTFTGTDGTFAFQRTPPGVYTVTALGMGDDLAAVDVVVKVVRGAEPAEVALRLPRGGRVRVTLVETGEEPSEIQCANAAGDDWDLEHEKGGTRFVSPLLPPGEYELTVTWPDGRIENRGVSVKSREITEVKLGGS